MAGRNRIYDLLSFSSKKKFGIYLWDIKKTDEANNLLNKIRFVKVINQYSSVIKSCLDFVSLCLRTKKISIFLFAFRNIKKVIWTLHNQINLRIVSSNLCCVKIVRIISNSNLSFIYASPNT